MKTEQNSCVNVKFSAKFWGYLRFMQIRQKIFNSTDMQITHIILDKVLKLLTCTIHYSLHMQLSHLKYSSVFGSLYIQSYNMFSRHLAANDWIRGQKNKCEYRNSIQTPTYT